MDKNSPMWSQQTWNVCTLNAHVWHCRWHFIHFIGYRKSKVAKGTWQWHVVTLFISRGVQECQYCLVWKVGLRVEIVWVLVVGYEFHIPPLTCNVIGNACGNENISLILTYLLSLCHKVESSSCFHVGLSDMFE